MLPRSSRGAFRRSNTGGSHWSWGPLRVAAWQCRSSLAGANPVRVVASHGPGMKPCRQLSNQVLGA